MSNSDPAPRRLHGRAGADPEERAGSTQVAVTVPADPTSLGLLRGIAGAVAMSLDFDVDAIADFRMAVDELGATVITRAKPDTDVQVVFAADDAGIEVAASSTSTSGEPLDRASFGWMVLTTLADEVGGTVEPTIDGSRDGASGSEFTSGAEFAVRATLRVHAARAGQ